MSGNNGESSRFDEGERGDRRVILRRDVLSKFLCLWDEIGW